MLSSFLMQTYKDKLSYHQIQGHSTGKYQLSGLPGPPSRKLGSELLDVTEVHDFSVRNSRGKSTF